MLSDSTTDSDNTVTVKQAFVVLPSMATWPLKEDVPYTYRGTKVVLKVRPGKIVNGKGVVSYKVIGDIYGDRDKNEPSESYYRRVSLDDIDEAAEKVVERVNEEIDEQTERCEEVTEVLETTAQDHGGQIEERRTP